MTKSSAGTKPSISAGSLSAWRDSFLINTASKYKSVSCAVRSPQTR